MRLTEKTDSGSWCLRDVPWDQLKTGVVLTERTWKKIYGALWKLKDYEDSGKTPEEVKHLVELSGSRIEQKWISVMEQLPAEHDSIFKKFKGTNRWHTGMYEKISDDVIVKIKYEDGTLVIGRAYTRDGVWKTAHEILRGKVVAWIPFLEPKKEKKNE